MILDENIWLFIFIILLIIIYFMIPDNINEKESYKIENFSDKVIDPSLKSNQYYFKNSSDDKTIKFTIKDNNSEPLILKENDIIELILTYKNVNNNIKFKKFYFKVLTYNNETLTLSDINTDNNKKKFVILQDIDGDNNIVKKKFESSGDDFFLGEFNFIKNNDNSINTKIFYKLFDPDQTSEKEITIIDSAKTSTTTTPANIVFKEPLNNKNLKPNNFIKFYYYVNDKPYNNKEDNIQYMQIINYNNETKTLNLINADTKSNQNNSNFLYKDIKFYIIFEIIDDSNTIIDKYQKEYSRSLSATNYMDHLIENMNMKVKNLNKIIKKNEKNASQGNNRSIIYYFTKIIEKYENINKDIEKKNNANEDKTDDNNLENLFIIEYYKQIIKKIKDYDYNIESGESFSNELGEIYKTITVDAPSAKLINLHENLIKTYIDDIIKNDTLDIDSID